MPAVLGRKVGEDLPLSVKLREIQKRYGSTALQNATLLFLHFQISQPYLFFT